MRPIVGIAMVWALWGHVEAAHAQKKRPARYTIEEGDILFRVARRYGCTVADLVNANPDLDNPNQIGVGQKLRIPKCDGKTRKAPAKKSETKRKAKSTRANKRRSQTGKICDWRTAQINSNKLARLMHTKGFTPPAKFRALVVRLDLTKNKKKVLSQRVYDYGGLSDRTGGWNPASTIKIYPATAVLEMLHKRGLHPNANALYHYAGAAETFSVKKLIARAVSPSDNIAHNRLVQLAGYDGLNGSRGFFKRYGLRNTYIVKAYDQTGWRNRGQSKSFLKSPAITLKTSKKTVRLPARTGTKVRCYGSVCTSIGDLARFHCRLMLHEQLPSKRRFKVPTTWLHNGIRKNLRGVESSGSKKERRSRRRGREVVLGLAKSLKGDRYKFYHKPGFAREWFSDVVYVYDRIGRTRWLVAMAGFPGRTVLNDASRIVGELIHSGALK